MLSSFFEDMNVQDISESYFEKNENSYGNEINDSFFLNYSNEFRSFSSQENYLDIDHFQFIDKSTNQSFLGKKIFKTISEPIENEKENIIKRKNLFNIKDISLNKNESNKLIISDRKFQLDNFSLKFFKKINQWHLSKINQKLLNQKLSPPNYKLITHNTNIKDIFLYSKFKFKDILCFNLNDKQILDEILIKKGYKKKRKYPEIKLNEKEKENLIQLLKKINIKDISNENEITINDKNSLINILYKKGYKNENDKFLVYEDKKYLNKIIIENKIIKEKKSYNLQEHNKDLIKKIGKLPELEIKYGELFNKYLSDNVSNEFKNNKDIIKIDENFQKLKNKSKYSLLKIYGDKCGFIKMIEEDSSISSKDKNIIDELFNFLDNKDINEEELRKYNKNN